MRTKNQWLLIVCSLPVACLLQGCPLDKATVNSLVGETRGTWEWVKTTTPTRTITPQSAKYTKQLSVATDGKGAYAAFYRNDTLQRRVNETKTDTSHTIVDTARETVLIGYGNDGYIKYNVVMTGTSTRLIVSEVLKPYNISADTIKSEYQRVSKSLYPY